MSIANELIVRGRTRHTLQDREGRVCLIGAACKAHNVEIPHNCALYPDTHTKQVWIKLPENVRYALQVATGRWGLSSVISFNDSPESTDDEVLLVAKRADEIIG